MCLGNAFSTGTAGNRNPQTPLDDHVGDPEDGKAKQKTSSVNCVENLSLRYEPSSLGSKLSGPTLGAGCQ